jgi:hypothetical protein
MSQGFHCPECGSYEITGTAQAACRSSASAKERADISVAIQQRQPEVVMVRVPKILISPFPEILITCR